MCNCTGSCLGSCVIDLTGIGQIGATGSQGGYGGYSSVWNYSTSTVSGTTSGQLRFNSATYASVTTMYISKTNADTTDLNAFLASLSNGTYFGKIRIFKKSDSSKFWEGNITAVSAGATEYTLTVSYILANSTFAASDPIVLSFTPNGLGAKPVYFTHGGTLLTSATTGSWVTPVGASVTLPAGMLVTVGDYTEIVVRGIMGATASHVIANGIRGDINGTSIGNPYLATVFIEDECFYLAGTPSVLSGEYYLKFYLERLTSTTLIVYIDSILDGTEYRTYVSNNSGLTVNNLDTLTNTFNIQIYNGDSTSTVKIRNIKAIKYLQ